MTNQEDQPLQEAKRKEKHLEEETVRLAKEQMRKKAYLDREEAIEKASEARRIKRLEEQAAEESERSAREQSRREAYLTKEQAIAEAHEARKLKDKKQAPE